MNSMKKSIFKDLFIINMILCLFISCFTLPVRADDTNQEDDVYSYINNDKYIYDEEVAIDRIYLDVNSKFIQGKSKIDILFVIDVSSSMLFHFDEDRIAADYRNSRFYKIIDVVNSFVNTVHDNEKFDVMYSVVEFGGYFYDYLPYSDGKVKVDWTDNPNAVRSSLSITDIVKDLVGTNYQAGLYSAKQQLAKARDDAQTITVFISDGLPTLYYNRNGYRMGNGTD